MLFPTCEKRWRRWRKLKSLNTCSTISHTFYQSVVESSVLASVTAEASEPVDSKKVNKAGNVGCLCSEAFELRVKGRMLLNIKVKTAHLLNNTAVKTQQSFQFEASAAIRTDTEGN